MTYLINSDFLFRDLTGIERFAYEICIRLDKLINNHNDVRIVIPANAKKIPDFKNIKIIRTNKPIKSFPLWDLFEFASWCRKLNAIGINFSNTAPIGKKCGISFIHDIYAKQYPADFISIKEKLIRIYSCLNYYNISKNAEIVLTVSEFSKTQIHEVYKTPEERIKVIPNGWDHFKYIEEKKITDFQDFLIPGTFYFTLGSLQKRKNLGWILNYAQKHPDEKFAISGKSVSGFASGNINELKKLSNIKLLGYVTDSQVKWLMKNCKAFVFPSYYEGFGIPPLEALSVGAKIIIGNAASLPEIYKNSAIYIDSKNTDCNLNKMLNNFIASTSETERNKIINNVLNEYTYDKAAHKLYTILK